jgi:AcrR family transcriptional regulator
VNQLSTSATGRRQRADGERSRRAILEAAASLATVEGIDGLSIGRLAEHVGMSKSGLYAHFGSKQELQLATIDTAREIFAADVTVPALEADPGVSRVLALCDAFLLHLERGRFPGGCFFVSTAIELDAKEGPVVDYLREVSVEFVETLTAEVLQAQELGELPRDLDVPQLVFELDSFLIGANLAFVFFRNASALDRARAAVRGCVDRARSEVPETG